MTETSLKGDFDSIKIRPLLSKDEAADKSSSDEDDFEAGNNQIELKDDVDIEDE